MSLGKFKSSAKELNNIALPLIIQNMTGVIVVATDKAIIGRISPEAFVAVGVVGSLLSLLAGILGYISVQFNISGGKASIQDDNSEDLTDEFTSALFLNAIIGMLFFVLIIPSGRPLFVALYGFEGYMLDAAVNYASIMSIYLLFQLLLFSFWCFTQDKEEHKMDIIYFLVCYGY